MAIATAIKRGAYVYVYDEKRPANSDAFGGE